MNLVHSGKVRDVYDAGDDRLLMVTSDRISAFDVVLDEPIPDKGRVLTALTAFWLDRLADIAPSHLVRIEDEGEHAGRAMLVRRAEMLPIECIVRGYLSGSAWKEYQRFGHRPRPAPARRPPAVRPAARARLHPVHQGRGRPPRREHLRRAGGGDRRASDRRRGRRHQPGRLPAGGRRTPPSTGSSSPTPSSSWAGSTAGWPSATRSSPPTRPASGRRPTGSRAPSPRRSTSSRCATGWRPPAGTRPAAAAAPARGGRRHLRPLRGRLRAPDGEALGRLAGRARVTA